MCICTYMYIYVYVYVYIYIYIYAQLFVTNRPSTTRCKPKGSQHNLLESNTTCQSAQALVSPGSRRSARAAGWRPIGVGRLPAPTLKLLLATYRKAEVA